MPPDARHDTQGRGGCQPRNLPGNCRRGRMKSNKKTSVRGDQAQEPAAIGGGHMGNDKKIGAMTPQEIRRLVAEKYTEVARAPHDRYKFRVGTQYARDLGYPALLLENLPPALSEAFTGVSASLITLSEAKAGETVL